MEYIINKKINAKEAIQVKIRFNDECKNGHHNFGITGMTGYAQRGSYDSFNLNGTNYRIDRCGCIHDTILKHFPKFKIFVDLHLCNKAGQPMYTVANGFYHLKNSSKEVTMNYLRINEDQYNKLSVVDSKHDFHAYLQYLNIPQMWEKQANEAFNYLLKLTGNESYTFEESNPSLMEVLDTDTMEKFKQRLDSGYFSEKEVEQRRKKAKEQKIQKEIAKLKEEYNNDIAKMKKELDIKIHLLELGCNLSTVIYYNYNNTLKFNWGSTKISDSEYQYLVENIDYSRLPNDIKIIKD